MTTTMNGKEGRDARGRFAKGNGGGPGNPFARRMAQLRRILLETVTDAEMSIIAGELVLRAKNGDLAAIKLLFQYVLGKPGGAIDPHAEGLREDGEESAPAAAEQPTPAGRLQEVVAALARVIPPAAREEVGGNLRGAAGPQESRRQRPAEGGPEARRGVEMRSAESGGDGSVTKSDRPPSGNGGNGANGCQDVPRRGAEGSVRAGGPWGLSLRGGHRDKPGGS
jgi:hypothetical protein